MRNEIVTGKFAPGSRLPSTATLATRWHSSVYTMHTALAALAKEGWIERIHGAGTFVAEPYNRFTCAAIYHQSDIGADRESHYGRILQDCLLKQLAAHNKDVRIFTDSRAPENRGTILPALAEAIRDRHVQCVIAPAATFALSPGLAKITLPTAYAGNLGSPNRVDFDKGDFLREGVRSLARQRCRSVGMIVPYGGPRTRLENNQYPFAEMLKRIARQEGLATCSDWISILPDKPASSYEHHGYREFRELWHLKKKPDGLLVFPDTIARGVITAVLRQGVDLVLPGMKFVFHRNAHTDLLCPFPVTWAISNENLLVTKLIEIIEIQFRGEKARPILLPFEMRSDDGTHWD